MAERGQIELGDEAKDQITGFSGVVIAITNWLAGCQRVSVQPRELKDGKPIESVTFDVEQLDLVKSARKVVAQTGGPHDAPRRQADPQR